MKSVCTEVSTVGDLLIRSAETAPDRPCVVFPDKRETYAQMCARAVTVARGLLAIGISPGEHVGLLMPNSLDYIGGFFGIALIGAVAVPMNIRNKASELGYIIANADMAAVLSSSEDVSHVDLCAVLADALPGLERQVGDRLELSAAPRLRQVIDLGGAAGIAGIRSRAWFEAAAGTTSAEAVEQARRAVMVRDPAMILYTSGTTARPKGCILSHEAVTRGPVERARHRLSAPDVDVTWAAGPLFHIGSLAPFIGSVGVAGTFLTDRFFEPGRAVDLLAREKPTLVWPWFSAIVQGIIDHPRFDPAAFDKLRYFFIIAPDTLVERVLRLFPDTEILQGCGMTETAGVFALSDPDEDAASRARTQGKPAPGVAVRIIDPATGGDCPPGVVGEIWVRGYNVMDGYYRNPEQTLAALGTDGWLRTGDLYIRDAQGRLLFQGRLKDMLKVGGENVATVEVEVLLCSHPQVKLAEVVGRPDPRLDEVPVAFVEIRDAGGVSEEELIAYCKSRIANFKVPRAIYFMDEADWPMSATKVDKRALRQRLLQNSPA
ncbi:acyl--CoA ligase [Sphingomonas sp. C8-2]|nr:acyl--CoA ligase [Sphingomonas sp. C8-2]